MITEKLKDLSIVDVLTVVTPFIIIVGLIHKLGIYTSPQVDASWLISIFSPTDYMLSDLKIYIFYIVSILYLDKVLFKPDFTPCNELFWANIQLLSGYFGVLLILWYKHESLSQFTYFYFIIALSLNGFGILFLSKRFGKIFGLGLILLVPYLSGKQHVDEIFLKEKPVVELNDNKKWYLIDKHSNQLILINTQDNKNEFKIVEMKEIKILK